MDIFIQVGLFIVGFYILIKGANILIRGATSVARVLGVSDWFIGVVIIGIGTSVPEFSINIASAFNGNSIGLATLIGSNTFNILVILGLSAIVTPIVMKREWVSRDFLINIGAVIVAAIVILFAIGGTGEEHIISRPEGIFLAILFVIWLVTMFRGQRDGNSTDFKIFSIFTSILLIIIGILGVFFGGRWVVDGAGSLAIWVGVSPTLVGLTVVAVGTSVPELAVSTIAAIRRNTKVAVGNVLGSNIFDFLGIIGMTALIQPIRIVENVQFDILITLAVTFVLLASMYIGRRRILTRQKGFVFIALYIIYLIAIIIRG